MEERSLIVWIVVVACLAVPTLTSLTISPASPTTNNNCIPFGMTTGYGYAGFVYNNIPAFRLAPGDQIAFDLGLPDTTQICRAIYMTTPSTFLPNCNLATFNVPGWSLVASMQCVGFGDSVVGNWDITFTATAHFNFDGGQLVIGVLTDGNPFVDSSCVQVRVCCLGAIDCTLDLSVFFHCHSLSCVWYYLNSLVILISGCCWHNMH